jgi:hypothetical protein
MSHKHTVLRQIIRHQIQGLLGEGRIPLRTPPHGLTLHRSRDILTPSAETLADAYSAALSEDPDGAVPAKTMLDLLDAMGFPGRDVMQLDRDLAEHPALGLRLAWDGAEHWVVPSSTR